jgi:hypothetical protein
MCTCKPEERKSERSTAYVVVDLCPECTAKNEASRIDFNGRLNESKLVAEELQEMARERLRAKGKL